MQSYVEGGSKAKEAASLIMSRTMGGRKAEKFSKTVSEVERRASTDLINTSRPSAAASSSSPTTTVVGSSSSPTPHSGSLNNNILTAHGHEILTSPSPAALPSVQQPLPSPIFPGPAPGFHPSFDPKMLLAQQQPLLSRLAPRQIFFEILSPSSPILSQNLKHDLARSCFILENPAV